MSSFTRGQAAAMLGVHPRTLRRWEREGKIPSARRILRNNFRVYTDEDIQSLREWMTATSDPGPVVKERVA